MNLEYNNEITLFSKNSPIHVLSECEKNLSLLDRLRLFGFNDNKMFLLTRLLAVSTGNDRKLFTVDEVEYLNQMNLRLDIPRVYFLTEKNDEDVLKKFILLGYHEEIPSQHYTVETMNIASKLGKLNAIIFLHERKCPWDEWTPKYAAKNGHLKCLKYVHENDCDWDYQTPIVAAQNGHLDCLKYAHENGCLWDGDMIIRCATKNGQIGRAHV